MLKCNEIKSSVQTVIFFNIMKTYYIWASRWDFATYRSVERPESSLLSYTRQGCKFRFFREDFIFAKLRICSDSVLSFVKIKPSRYGKITLSFIDLGKSCISREFFTSLICLLMLFAKIKFSRKFRIYSRRKFRHQAVLNISAWAFQ